jgi:uncharacterized protein
MKFDDDAKLDSSQVDDQRGRRSSGGGLGGGFGRSSSSGGLGGGGIPMGKAGGGAGLLMMIVLAIVASQCGGGGGSGIGYNDPFNQGAAQIQESGSPANVVTGSVQADCKTGADANKRQDCRNLAVINDVNAFWTDVFQQNQIEYPKAQTTFFSGDVQTGCGAATSDVGPFYCPADSQIYIDLTFFEELQSKFEATGGPFAEAYVVAHEYGHHIQNVLGTSAKVQQSGDKSGEDSAAVRLELQADCYAGVWASNATRGNDPLIVELTDEDIRAGLDAAARVGDDFIQKKFQGRINREAWTHGSSAQRQSWFMKGYRSGEPSRCDTFSGEI